MNLERWLKECLSKKRYLSYDFAEKLAKKIEAEKGVKLYVYICPSCTHYHLTKRPQGKNRYKYIKAV